MLERYILKERASSRSTESRVLQSCSASMFFSMLLLLPVWSMPTYHHHPRSKESQLQLLSNDPTGSAIGGWGMLLLYSQFLSLFLSFSERAQLECFFLSERSRD